jgi:integrase
LFITGSASGFRKLGAHNCPVLGGRAITPPTFRHATAMRMLQAGVAPEVIALWLGHESPATTHLYIEADITKKEKALKQIISPIDRGNSF